MPKEMNKKRLYMCSLCGRIWESDELERGKHETLKLQRYSGGGDLSDRMKECPVCHAPLFTPEVTREALKWGCVVHPENTKWTIQEENKLLKTFLAGYIKDHKDHYEDFLPKEENLG